MAEQTVTPIVDTTGETTPVVTPQTTIKTFKQEEVDSLVKGRLGRERQEFARMLGLENYDEIKGFVDTSKNAIQTLETKETELKTLNEKASVLEQDLIKYKYQVKDDKFKEAMALAKLKQDGTELTIEDSLKEVLKEYPNMRNGITVGVEINQQPKDKPKYSREFLIANQGIPAFKALLDKQK